MDRCLKGSFWKLQNLLLLSKACGFSKNEFRPRASTLPGSLWEMQIPRPHHRPADLGTEGGAESSVFSKFSRRFWHTGVKDHCCRWRWRWSLPVGEDCISGIEPWGIQCTFIRRLEETLCPFPRKILSCFLASPLSQGQQKPGICVSCPHSHA